jgi:hypothetical protein
MSPFHPHPSAARQKSALVIQERPERRMAWPSGGHLAFDTPQDAAESAPEWRDSPNPPRAARHQAHHQHAHRAVNAIEEP